MYHSLIFNVTGVTSVWQRNHGAYRIAHWLRSNNWDVEVIDHTLLWDFNDLVSLAETRITKDTKFIGFSFLFDKWSETLHKFTLWLNTYYPDITLISGSNTFPQKDSPVDYHIKGFGEVAILKLLSYLFSNGTEPRMVAYGPTKVIDSTLYPAYPMEDYSVFYEDRDFLQPWEFLSLETARGCIFKCTFCNHPLLGIKEDYSTSAKSFEKELKENWYRWGIKNYIVTEETFNDRQDKIKKLGNVIKELDFDPWLSGYIRVDLLLSRPNERELLEDMNFLGQFYGVESLYHKTAKAFKKGMDPNRIKEGLIQTKEYYAKTGKYRGTVALILGGPHEPIESMYNTLDWCIENWNDQALLTFPMTIPIGEFTRESELTKNYKKYGYESRDLSYFEKKYPNEQGILNRIRNMSDTHEYLLWENEHLDLIKCVSISNDFSKTIVDKGFKLPNFAIAKVTGSDVTMEQRFKLTVADMINDTKRKEWYKEYIMKKLNWAV